MIYGRARWIALHAATAMIVLALGVSHASAQRVGVHSDASGDRLARRLQAELRTRGYDARDLANGAAPPLDTLDAILWAHDEPRLVRVCVSASASRTTTCEDLTGDDDDVLLIQAIELVRAHLGDPTPIPSEPAREAPPEPVIPTPLGHEWTVGLGASVEIPTGNVSTGGAAVAVIGFSPDPWLAFELGGLATVIDPRVDDVTGSASISPRLVWLGVDLRIPETVLAGHRLLLGAQVGCGGSELHARPSPTFAARDSAFVTAVLMARATFVLRLVDGVGLSIGGRVGAALPQPVLVFDGREVARWGAPLVSLELGVVFRI